MQPIHYSLIFNIITLAVCTALAWRFEQPMLVVLALVLSQHALARFSGDDDDDEGEDDEGSAMGFLANVK